MGFSVVCTAGSAVLSVCLTVCLSVSLFVSVSVSLSLLVGKRANKCISGTDLHRQFKVLSLGDGNCR